MFKKMLKNPHEIVYAPSKCEVRRGAAELEQMCEKGTTDEKRRRSEKRGCGAGVIVQEWDPRREAKKEEKGQ